MCLRVCVCDCSNIPETKEAACPPLHLSLPPAPTSTSSSLTNHSVLLLFFFSFFPLNTSFLMETVTLTDPGKYAPSVQHRRHLPAHSSSSTLAPPNMNICHHFNLDVVEIFRSSTLLANSLVFGRCPQYCYGDDSLFFYKHTPPSILNAFHQTRAWASWSLLIFTFLMLHRRLIF